MTHHAPKHIHRSMNPEDAHAVGKRKLVVIAVALTVLVILRAVFSHYAVIESALDTADHAALIGELAFIFEG